MRLRKGQLFESLLMGAVILWITAIIAAYFVIHKPWGTMMNWKPLLAFLDIGLALAMVSLAGGTGRRLLGALPDASATERAALHGAMGLGAFGIGWLAAGLMGLLQAWFAWLVLIGGLVFLRREAWAWCNDLYEFIRLPHDACRLSRLARWFVLLLFTLNLLSALAPPLKWDSLVYHLTLPAAYVKAGRVFNNLENLYAGFPQNAEMLFAWGIQLHSVQTALVLNWFTGILAFAGIDGFSRRLVGKDASWLAPAILLTGTSISHAMYWGYVDIWLLLFGLAVFLAIDQYRTNGKRTYLIQAGLFLGFAVGVKYTAGVMVLMGAAALLPGGKSSFGQEATHEASAQLPSWNQTSSWRRFFKELFVYGACAALVFAPWLLKNFIMTGNPLHPIAVFDPQLDVWAQTFQSGKPPQHSWVLDIFLPLGVTLMGIESAVVVGWPEYSANIGPLLLALSPAALAGWKFFSKNQKTSLFRLMAGIGVTWLVWGVASHFADELMYPRHYYGAFAAWAVIAVAGFVAVGHLRLGQVRIGRVISALFILTLFLATWGELNAFISGNPLPVVWGLQSEQDYVKQQLGAHGYAIQAVNELPPEKIVYFLWEPRTFYCDRHCILDAKLTNWWYLRRTCGSAENIAAELRRRGVTHVLSNDLGARMMEALHNEYDESDWTELAHFIETELIQIHSLGGYTLYAISQE